MFWRAAKDDDFSLTFFCVGLLGTIRNNATPIVRNVCPPFFTFPRLVVRLSPRISSCSGNICWKLISKCMFDPCTTANCANGCIADYCGGCNALCKCEENSSCGGDYCSDVGVCLQHGECRTANDCMSINNQWIRPMCLGKADCQANKCVWNCM